MEDSQDYVAALEQTLEQRRAFIEEKEMRKLKESFRMFHSSYQAILNVLHRKGLLQEDPYKHDDKISDIEVPPEETFLESEKDHQMSVRLSRFDNQLDFLNNYFQFSLEYLNLTRIKTLLGLVKYVRWNQFSPTTAHMLTRTLAEYVTKIRSEADPLSAGIVKDSHDQIMKASRTILSILKEITEYQKETYKYDLRVTVLPELGLKGAAVADRDAALRAIKKRFVTHWENKPFYAELAGEVLEEDYSESGPALRQQVLQRLLVERQKPQEGIQKDRFKPILLDAVRTMAASSRALDLMLQKLSEGVVLLETRKLTFGERFRRWIEELVNKNQKPRVFLVEYIDEITSSSHTEEIDFDAFSEKTRKKARLLANLMNKMSNAYRKLEGASEDQILQFVSRQLEELQLTQRQMQSLETHLRAEIPRDQRNRLRGINVELTALKDNMVRANKKKHDYVSRKEEQEQLRKLGITENAGS